MSQYVYRNAKDTVRVNVHDVNHEDGRAREWNYDVWTRDDENGHSVETYSEVAGDLFPTKRDAVKFANEQYGNLKSICPNDGIIEGWAPLRSARI